MKLKWSKPRLAVAFALALWAAMLSFIILAQRLPYYLSPRTSWLAPVGGVTLTLAAFARLATARTTSSERLTSRHLLNLAVLVTPALLVIFLPPLTLGAFAAQRRGPSVSGAYAEATGRDLSTGDLSLIDIFGLSFNNELNQLAPRAGSTSSFVGFVSRYPGDAADEFRLNRFMITCCPGDAVIISLRIVGAPPGEFKPDDWVRVTGAIYPIGQQVVVDASEVVSIPRPKHPYLNPN